MAHCSDGSSHSDYLAVLATIFLSSISHLVIGKYESTNYRMASNRYDVVTEKIRTFIARTEEP